LDLAIMLAEERGKDWVVQLDGKDATSAEARMIALLYRIYREG
jgi:hypothetical protein